MLLLLPDQTLGLYVLWCRSYLGCLSLVRWRQDPRINFHFECSTAAFPYAHLKLWLFIWFLPNFQSTWNLVWINLRYLDSQYLRHGKKRKRKKKKDKPQTAQSDKRVPMPAMLYLIKNNQPATINSRFDLTLEIPKPVGCKRLLLNKPTCLLFFFSFLVVILRVNMTPIVFCVRGFVL